MSDEQDPVLLDISSDEYRYEACSITNDECHGYDCRTCETAICERRNEHDEEIKSICTFKSRSQNGIDAEVNEYNTVLKCGSIDDAYTYVGRERMPDLTKFTKTPGLIDKKIIDREYPHLNILMTALDLKTCAESYYLQESPLITIHEDVVILVAPRIESEYEG